MFGEIKRERQANRRIKKAKAEIGLQKKEIAEGTPQRQKEQADYEKSQVSQSVQQSKADRLAGREEGKKYAKEVLGRDVQGLDPVKRQAMQYEANKGIQRSMQAANRKLLGDQAQHGIVGRGGVGYAQQRDLQRMGTEAQAGVHRDLDKLNSDLALKKLAAMFNIEQGEASQAQLDRQMAIDEMEHANERKRQKNFEDRFYQQFNRV